MTPNQSRLPHRITNRPKLIRSGEIAYFSDRKKFINRDELAMILRLLTQRQLFGHVYGGLDPDYFDKIPNNSGVFVLPVLPTHVLMPGIHQPGDIDILVIPYEEEVLILEKSLAIEVKIVRATYKKQGKSPNEFGFTQVLQAIKLGFPYVAVVHIIVSDRSPRDVWREISIFQVVDTHGRVEPRPSQYVDLMPRDLIDRSFGRLERACPDARIGIASTYIETESDSRTGFIIDNNGIWVPRFRKCTTNSNKSEFLLNRIGMLFDKYANYFLDNPRYDP